MQYAPKVAALMVLTLLLQAQAVTMLGSHLASSKDPSLLNGEHVLSQNELFEFRIHVKEDEAVGNWSIDENFHSRTDRGDLWVGVDDEAHLARSLVKFDLSHISRNIAVESAKLTAYMSGALGLEDVPIGVHYTPDDTWSETTVTWRNQPEHKENPAGVIDSPASPEMFVIGNWYSWDITDEVALTVQGDRILSLVLKLTDELCPAPRGAVFTEDEYYHFNASYISVVGHISEAIQLSVNNNIEGVLVDYLQDPRPVLAWQLNDSDGSDFQADFELTIHDNPTFDGNPLWSIGHTLEYQVMTNGSSSSAEPFSISHEVRIQYKYSDELLDKSGIVDRIGFEVITNETEVTFKDLVVTLASTDIAGDLGSNFLSNYGSGTQIELLRGEVYTAPVSNGFLELDLANLFTLSQDMNLIVEIRYTNCSGGAILSRYTPSTGLGSVAYSWGNKSYEGNSASRRYSYCFGIQLQMASDSLVNWSCSDPTTPIPFGLPSNSSGAFQTKVNASLFTNHGTVNRLLFHVNSTAGGVIFENLTVMFAESNLRGRLNHSELSSNYDVASAVVVLERDFCKLWNFGGVLILDVEDEFYYSGTHDLLIQMSWDALSGNLGAFIGQGGYSAWNYTNVSQADNQNETWAPQIAVDFINSASSVQYNGPPLPEEQYVYWRVRVSDSSGRWSDWSTHSFRYLPITSGPEYGGLTVNPDPAMLLELVEIRINATFCLGVAQVLIEIDGTNHSMALAAPDSYAYSVIPERAGSIPFLIFMESAIGTWSIANGWIHVQADESTTAPNPKGAELLPLALIVGAGVVGVIALFRRRRSSS